MKIMVMGAGGMGGYIGGRLAQAGRDVTFIARGQHLRAIEENGLHVQSPAGDFVINPASATDNPEEAGPVDLILLCVKSYDVLKAAEKLKPALGAKAVIIPVQNGIEHINKLGSMLGVEHVLGGVSLISAQINAPGSVQHHKGRDILEFGEIGGGHSTRCEVIHKVLKVDGFKAVLSTNIIERMWWKLAAYSGAGVFCVSRGNKDVVWATPETKELYREAIAETVTLAKTKGVLLPASVPDEHIAILDTFAPDWKPSMLVDLEQGHPLELEYLHGTICAMGREAGLPTPINDYIYACLKPYVDGMH